LLRPFGYSFFTQGLLAAVMVGGLCGLIGVYVVLRRMSYVGHGLSHAIFGGAVVSYVIGANFYLGAGLWGFLAALLINATARRRGIGADAAIGIVTTASFAIGVALISRVRRFQRNIDAALFGNILGVTPDDLLAIAGVTLLAAVVIFVLYRHLLFTTFDPEVARVYGVPTEWVDTIFALILAATLIVSLQVMGVTLIAASLVIPPAVARLLTDSFHRMVLLSVGLGAACGLVGMLLSFYVEIASGAAIVLVGAALFLIVYGVTARRGRLARARLAAHDHEPPVRATASRQPSSSND
jgi:manganese/iron transport system permease protein/iron/zinc/copper transport system permease protein